MLVGVGSDFQFGSGVELLCWVEWGQGLSGLSNTRPSLDLVYRVGLGRVDKVNRVNRVNKVINGLS